MTAPRRLIVCGCRDWDHSGQIANALSAEWSLHGGPYAHVVVHGDCPTGADAFADRWCTKVGVQVERHAANWQLHGKQAGPRRNAEMAALGADLCLAFWDGESRGTLDMIRCAIRHGIPVRIVPRLTPTVRAEAKEEG